MTRNYTHYIYTCCLIFGMAGSAELAAQQFFKKLEDADKFFTQRISHFRNGDLLIGDSSIEAVRTGDGGEIYLTRMDPCGNIEWSGTYRREAEYLELKDLLISDLNEIYAYGSAYIGLDELLFILKLDSRGNIQQFRLYEPETVDHFSYNIYLKGDRLLAYGLILDFNTKKFGFVAVFDTALNFQWGKKFSPFASSGGAIITADNGFLCRSDQYLYRLDPAGELEWVTELAPNDQNSPISGPVEVPDGYILQAGGEGLSFFYKIDQMGQLQWTSDQFPAKSYPADLKLRTDGKISAVYSAQNGNEQELHRLLLESDGRITRQVKLQTDISIKPGRVFQSAHLDGPIVISVNPDPTVPKAVEAPSFLLSFSEDNPTTDCFSWEAAPSVRTNQVAMNFSPLDTIVLATEMRFINNTNIRFGPFSPPLTNACTDGTGQDLVQLDTFLECGDSWLVQLPTPEFQWEDEARDNPRILTEPGTYIAKNQDCDEQMVYEYTVQKANCACTTYLPTAFSPNQDGYNDELEFYAGCEIVSFSMSVFSRWGEKVFESRVPGIFWDGHYHSRPAPAGIYLVKVDYEWWDQNGNLQAGQIVQQITLTR